MTRRRTMVSIAHRFLPLALLLALAVAWVWVAAHAFAEEAPPRVEYYDTYGRRSSYSVTDPRTGITDVYDAKTSRRLGTFRSPNAVYDTHGKRVDGGLPAVALPKGGKGGGKK